MSAPCCILPGPVYQQSEEGGTSRQPAAPGRPCGQTCHTPFSITSGFWSTAAITITTARVLWAQHAVQSFQLMFWSTTIKLLPPVRCTMMARSWSGQLLGATQIHTRVQKPIVETITYACSLCLMHMSTGCITEANFGKQPFYYLKVLHFNNFHCALLLKSFDQITIFSGCLGPEI